MNLSKQNPPQTMSAWMLLACAVIVAALLTASLGASGASMLFQSPISPPGPSPTDTPVVTEEPTVVRTPTVIIVEPTPVPPAPIPTVPPQPTSGGPAPILWIIVGLVIVGLFVVIAISPKKPTSQE